ncbi:hypothetical protein [Nocardioides sp. Root151]|uniref:hypothetical protein n=1 Tax=Nocardioides sp. Root151 TaxID=1736475 RepID=UPI000702A22F|nr:hypothetical protein [Nocardioides sp. Root151]KQZ70690.1 hypothetical protein ASD66_14020 [Nocardioides sp. Root151]
MDDDLLLGQLQHHWAGSSAGVALFERVGRTHGDPEVAAEIRLMAAAVNDDREALRQIILKVGGKPSSVAATGARLAELLGRLKPNGRIVRRSPLTDVLELEMLRTAVSGKRSGWQLLRALAPHDSRLDERVLDELLRRAEDELTRLEKMHMRVGLERLLEPEPGGD